MVTVPQDSNNDPLMNPVRALAQTVQCILSYPGASPQSSICSYLPKGIILEFTQAEILVAFRENTSSIGKDKIGFGPDEIGTKSNRSAAAMAMFMDDTPVYIIMIMGRWLSDAFLKYIRRQLLEFSKEISSRMITNYILYSIPDHHALPEDPRTINPDSFATNLTLAPSSNCRVSRPVFSLWH